MQRKSQSISINTIIIAAIALAVLVVLFIVFTGRFKVFSEGVEKSGITCNEACRIAGYSSGSPGFCTQDKLSGSFRDVSTNQDCCCIGRDIDLRRA